MYRRRGRTGGGKAVDAKLTFWQIVSGHRDCAALHITVLDRYLLCLRRLPCLNVTQRLAGKDTPRIKREAPRTWDYLQLHADRLDARASSIYRNRPRFSVFGVGPYSFAPWKVAIPGFYKRLDFRYVGPVEDKLVVLDDTCYFLPCRTEHDARLLAELLNSKAARGFFRSFIFWDAKRPIRGTDQIAVKKYNIRTGC